MERSQSEHIPDDLRRRLIADLESDLMEIQREAEGVQKKLWDLRWEYHKTETALKDLRKGDD